jgi:VanZ family protein
MGAWVLQLAAVIVGSLLPGQMVPDIVGAHDKWAHFGGYVLLGFFPVIGVRSLRRGVSLALAAIPMGAALELLQHFVPGRTPDVFDALANSGGAIAGICVAGVLRRLLRLQ